MPGATRPTSRRRGAITCVGQPETLAGQASGQRFAKLGTTNALCVIHQSGQNLLDRCNGIAQGSGVGQTCKGGNPPSKGPARTELTLSTPNAASNPQQAIGQVTSFLQAHRQINAVMTLNTAIGTALVNGHPANKPRRSTSARTSRTSSRPGRWRLPSISSSTSRVICRSCSLLSSELAIAVAERPADGHPRRQPGVHVDRRALALAPPAFEGWWDVPVAEISEDPHVQGAPETYTRDREAQRQYLEAP